MLRPRYEPMVEMRGVITNTITLMHILTTMNMCTGTGTTITTLMSTLGWVRCLPHRKRHELWKSVVPFWRRMTGWQSATVAFSRPESCWS